MQIVKWEDRQPGDTFFSDLTSILGTGIHDAELALHPGAPTDFIPTHAGIIGFSTSEFPEGTVVEAYCGTGKNKSFENSVAAINSSSKYAPWAAIGKVEVWRTAKTVSDSAVQSALHAYIKEYGPEGY